MTPTYRFADARRVDARFLDAEGIRGVVWDVDGTLMAYHDRDVAPLFREQIRGLFREGPARHAILSNCDEERYSALAEIFPEVPVLRGYHTPEGLVFRMVQHQVDSLGIEAVRRILQSGHQLRKPSPYLLRYAMQVLQVDAEALLVVGDQYMTDVAAAGQAGARSVKVDTYAIETFPRSLRLTQRVERVLSRLFVRADGRPGAVAS